VATLCCWPGSGSTGSVVVFGLLLGTSMFAEYLSSLSLHCLGWTFVCRPRSGAAGSAIVCGTRAAGDMENILLSYPDPDPVFPTNFGVCFWHRNLDQIPKERKRKI
jgi:hypothetical protein